MAQEAGTCHKPCHLKMKTIKILFLQGGWDGHKPEQHVHKFSAALINGGCKTETITSLERLADADYTL
jgi:type 1 glutamine amidotransferase